MWAWIDNIRGCATWSRTKVEERVVSHTTNKRTSHSRVLPSVQSLPSWILCPMGPHDMQEFFATQSNDISQVNRPSSQNAVLGTRSDELSQSLVQHVHRSWECQSPRRTENSCSGSSFFSSYWMSTAWTIQTQTFPKTHNHSCGTIFCNINVIVRKQTHWPHHVTTTCCGSEKVLIRCGQMCDIFCLTTSREVYMRDQSYCEWRF